MSPETLEELIASGEKLNLEFKGERARPLSDRELAEAVACLANRPGDEPGWLLVGVEDDGKVTGARPRREAGLSDQRRVQAVIANLTRPSLTCRAELVTLAKKPVLVIEVPASRVPVGTTDGKYQRRAITVKGKPECLPFHFHEMQARQADRGILDASALIVPEARWQDLDPLEFERYRRSIRESRGQADATLLDLPDLELAKALGAVAADHEVTGIRMLGLLLFGKDSSLRELLPSHEAAFQVLSGIGVGANDFFHWPLVRLMDELMSRFRALNREEELIVKTLRVAVPDYSERAFREGVANALIHRDYTRLGAVHVQWREDRIEISSPGGFPEGVRLDNLLVTPPHPRNPLLADAFKRAGIVERTARGIDTIFYEQLRNGRPLPDYQRSTETHVVLVMPGGKANLGFVRLIAEEGQAGRPLGLDELLILNRLWNERRLTPQEAASAIQKSEREARVVLERAVEAGLVEGRGEGKARVYHLSASVYRRAGAKAAYTRMRGFEPLQHQQMVLKYAEMHGSISTREAADLCRISRPQAYRLLQYLENERLIRSTGRQGRSVRYKKVNRPSR